MKHQLDLRLRHRLWSRDWKCGNIWSWIICGSKIIQMQGRIKWHQSALDWVLGSCNMLKYKLQTVLQRLKMWGQWIEDYLRTVEADYPPSTPILWPSAPHKYTDKKQLIHIDRKKCLSTPILLNCWTQKKLKNLIYAQKKKQFLRNNPHSVWSLQMPKMQESQKTHTVS